MIDMIDAIVSPETTGQPIPGAVMGAPAVAGYEAGNSWLTYPIYARARPDLSKKGWVVSITLTCLGHARCYDIETGGGSNSNIGVFMRNADHEHGLPWIYTFASNAAGMLAAARSFGFEQGKHFYYWGAHTGRGKHLCSPNVCGFPRADGTQYEFDSAFDRSTLQDYMLPSKPIPVDPYAMYPDNLPRDLPNKGNERLTVEQADGALAHPGKYHDYLKRVVYFELKEYRDRIWKVAHYVPPGFRVKRRHADWGDLRGPRWQALNTRMKKIATLH